MGLKLDKFCSPHVLYFFKLTVYKGYFWKDRSHCDLTLTSCQASDVLSQMQNRCRFPLTLQSTVKLLSCSDSAHPTKTSCSYRQCCPGPRQDMIQGVLSAYHQLMTPHKYVTALIPWLILFYSHRL